MADISNLKIGSNIYSIKDPTARSTASNADSKADQAILDSSAADTKAKILTCFFMVLVPLFL